MNVSEIAPGLWHWTGFHPEWNQDVGCVYVGADDAVALIDPIVPPEEAERFLDHLDADVARAGRPVHVVLTIYWHARSAAALCERYDATLWAPVRSALPVARRTGLEPERIRAGDRLPAGLEAHASGRPAEAVFYLPGHCSLVAGDVLLGSPLRVCPAGWVGKGGREAVRDALRPFLEHHPLERVLVSHGEPVLSGGSEALVSALRF
jgi:glyoxylase-like metal-dependent hydrolase (beta-lactamase superfamily II)